MPSGKGGSMKSEKESSLIETLVALALLLGITAGLLSGLSATFRARKLSQGDGLSRLVHSIN
jgi:type II secretory pathway pseudopilin PulG